MKKIFVLVLALATVAMAENVMWPDGRIRDHYPKSLSGEGWSIAAPSLADYAASGFRLATAGEVAAQEAAELADAQEAEAAAALPQVFPTGIAVLDDAGHHIKLIPTGDGLPVIGGQVSNSPLDPETEAAMSAAAKAKWAGKIKKINDARNKGNGQSALAARVAALEDALAGPIQQE